MTRLLQKASARWKAKDPTCYYCRLIRRRRARVLQEVAELEARLGGLVAVALPR